MFHDVPCTFMIFKNICFFWPQISDFTRLQHFWMGWNKRHLATWIRCCGLSVSLHERSTQMKSQSTGEWRRIPDLQCEGFHRTVKNEGPLFGVSLSRCVMWSSYLKCMLEIWLYESITNTRVMGSIMLFSWSSSPKWHYLAADWWFQSHLFDVPSMPIL